MSDILKKILVVGQTPPPYHGQAIMIENILKIESAQLQFYHVRLAFSSDIAEVGIFKLKKILHLFIVICKIYYYRVRHNIKILYYPPAGPNLIAIIRDILILITTRFLFRKVIYHFHAGGISDFLKNSNKLLRLLSNLAYNNPALTIRLSELNPDDGLAFHSHRDVIIPHGIPDFFQLYDKELISNTSGKIIILYVGVLKKTKGIEYLIDAIRIVVKLHNDVELRLVGKFESKEYEVTIKRMVQDYQLINVVRFCGVKSGIEKFHEYFKANIFCFPTFYEAETFGIVLLEAMQFSLPIVATSWRAIPGIISNGEEGYIVPPKDSQEIAEKIICLIKDEALRKRMGRQARLRYLKDFQNEIFCSNISKAFTEI